MTATAPAKTFGLYPRKGAIALGFDADLAIYDIDSPWSVEGSKFRGLATWSAFEGMTCRSTVKRTLVRGKTVYNNGEKPVAKPGYGEFIARIR